MAIVRILAAANPPTAIGDWTQALARIGALALAMEQPLRVIGSNVVKGAVFQIGGTVYQADADTAISGSASNYVKLTPSGDGSTVSASFVASLVTAGVAWNSTYCGWYDSGSPAALYIFDESKALTAGQIAAMRKNRDVTVPMGTGWLAGLAVNLASGWATVFASVMAAGWAAVFGSAPGTGWAAALAAAKTAFDANTVDGAHFVYTVGDCIFEPTVENGGNPTTYTPMVVWKVDRSGTIRVSAKGAATGLAYNDAFFRVYVNGVAVGAVHTITAETLADASYVFDDVAVAIGDTVGVYAYETNVLYVVHVECRLMCDQKGLFYEFDE